MPVEVGDALDWIYLEEKISEHILCSKVKYCPAKL